MDIEQERTIRFSPCPIKKHRGEIWEKLHRIDLNKPAILDDVRFMWDNEVPLEAIKKDTFSDFDKDDWLALLNQFYRGPVFGIMLYFDHPNGKFTTFRAYDWRRALWYSNSIGKPFKIIVKGLNDGISLGARRRGPRKKREGGNGGNRKNEGNGG